MNETGTRPVWHCETRIERLGTACLASSADHGQFRSGLRLDSCPERNRDFPMEPQRYSTNMPQL